MRSEQRDKNSKEEAPRLCRCVPSKGHHSGGLAGMLSCDRNLGPLNFIITGPFVNKFEDITVLLSKISMLRRLQVKEMKMESSERKHFNIA